MSDVLNLEDKNMSGDAGGRYLCFSLGADKFAIPLLQAKEVIGNIEITPIPQSPAYFKGVMNLRGQIISVIDLRSKLNMGKSEATDEQTTIILLELNPLSLGVVVDSVDNVATFDAGNISQPPYADNNIKLGFITGIARTNEVLTLILDLKIALNVEDYKIIENQNKNITNITETK